MKVHLLNSAMMPAADGIYESTEIAQQEFFQAGSLGTRGGATRKLHRLPLNCGAD